MHYRIGMDKIAHFGIGGIIGATIAIVSFAYNVGIGNFKKSTLARKILKDPSFTTEEQIRVYFGGDSSFADNSSGQVSIDLPASKLHDVLADIYLKLNKLATKAGINL